jgi:hypothetical protein
VYRIYPVPSKSIVYVEKVKEFPSTTTVIGEFELVPGLNYIATSGGDLMRLVLNGERCDVDLLCTRSNVESRKLHPEHGTTVVEITYPKLTWFAATVEPPAWDDV